MAFYRLYRMYRMYRCFGCTRARAIKRAWQNLSRKI